MPRPDDPQPRFQKPLREPSPNRPSTSRLHPAPSTLERPTTINASRRREYLADDSPSQAASSAARSEATTDRHPKRTRTESDRDVSSYRRVPDRYTQDDRAGDRWSRDQNPSRSDDRPRAGRRDGERDERVSANNRRIERPRTPPRPSESSRRETNGDHTARRRSPSRSPAPRRGRDEAEDQPPRHPRRSRETADDRERSDRDGNPGRRRSPLRPLRWSEDKDSVREEPGSRDSRPPTRPARDTTNEHGRRDRRADRQNNRDIDCDRRKPPSRPLRPLRGDWDNNKDTGREEAGDDNAPADPRWRDDRDRARPPSRPLKPLRGGRNEESDTRDKVAIPRQPKSLNNDGRVLDRKAGSAAEDDDRRHHGGRPTGTVGPQPHHQQSQQTMAVRDQGWRTVRAGNGPAVSADRRHDRNNADSVRQERKDAGPSDSRPQPPGSPPRPPGPPPPLPPSAVTVGPTANRLRPSHSGMPSPGPPAPPTAPRGPSSDSTSSPRNGAPPKVEIQESPQPYTPPQVEPGEGYERIHQVGEGTYGQVFKAVSEKTGVLVALKKIRMESEKDGFPVTAMREIKLLQALRHENVVRLHEMMVARSSVYMIFEYMEHDLNGVLAHPQIHFTEAHLKSLSSQLFKGLSYLHHKSVLHRDLKGSNILLNNQGVLKLADFGLARFYTKRRQGDYTNRVVTLWYRPPELLFGTTKYGPELDMWGAGCIFLELFTKKPAFQGHDEIHQLSVIRSVLGPFTPSKWPDVEALPWYEMVNPLEDAPSEAAPLVENGPNGDGDGSSMDLDDDDGDDDGSKAVARKATKAQVPSVPTSDDPEQAFKASFGSLMSPYALEVAQRLLDYDPRRRASAEEALELPYFSALPRAEMPAGLLTSVGGEWHEYESRRAKKKAHKMAHDRAQADAQAAHRAAQAAAASNYSNGRTATMSTGPQSAYRET